jgi:hypothetical protein
MVVGNPIMSREEAVAKCVIVEPDDGAMEKSIRDRFPELCDSDREFETFESVVKMGRGEEQRQTTRKLVKMKIDGTDGNLWEQMIKLRAEMEGEGIGQVAMHQLRCVDAKKMRKLVQVAFRGSSVKVNIHVPRDSNQEKKQESTPEEGEEDLCPGGRKEGDAI